MSQQTILAGQTGLEVRTILNENFTELYDSKITTIRGWGYQDFDAGVINSTTVTLTDNTNGADITFDSTKVIAGTAFIVVASNNLQVPCTGTSTWLFSSKVTATNVVADTVILSGVPHIGWGALRIFYLYDYVGKIPDGNILAPKFISSQVLDILNASFATDIDVASKQDTLAFVSETENKFLRDDNTFQSIEPPAGGYANNLYFDEEPSDVEGYETLTYTPNVSSIIETHTVNDSEGDKALHTYLYTSGVSVTNFPSGLWAFNFYGKVSSAVGVTQLGVTYFARHIDNSETDLFTVWSEEINNTTDMWIKFITTQPNFTVVETDRMGARILVKTTHNSNITITYTVGDGYGAYLNNPNKIRHSQLRDWNGDSNYLHVTSAEKSTWNGKLDGTGTTNEVSYWVDADTLGALSTASYPSLTELAYVKGSTSTLQTQIDGRNPYHGVLARPVGASNPLPANITTATFTLGATTNPITYYYQGTRVLVNSNKTATLDDGLGGSTAGLYYVYFNGVTGNILATKSFPGIDANSNVIIATVNWNGTNYGLVNDERHSYNRNKAWHNWAHNTIGTRYKSGITLTHNSGTGNAATFSTTSGEIWDEDIQFVVNASSDFPTPNTCRLFYQTGAASYSFVTTTSTTPGYLGANQRPYYVNSTGYVLTEMSSAVNRYINVFVYATTSLHTPIQIFTETVSNTVAGNNGYTSLANARAVPFPNLSGYGLSSEMKALYRLIWRADGVLQAIDVNQDDYRTVTSLPMAAGNVSTTASAVTFNASGGITATTVQTAIEELDAEKEFLWYETTVDLSSAGWTANTQTETISGLTSTSDIIVYPPSDRTSFIDFGNAQISATSAGTDSITFTCTTTPTANINGVIIRWRN